MTRKSLFWHNRQQRSPQRRGRARGRRRRASALREARLGVEWLETRHLLSAGSLDTTFNPAGPIPGVLVSDLGFIEDGQAVAVQADGKILIGGTFEPAGGANARNFAVARYLTNGQLDTTFGTADSDGINGLATVDFFARGDNGFDMLIDSLGRIVVVGQGRNSAGSSGIGAARFDVNGNLDTGFGTGGKAFHNIPGFVVEPRGVAEQSDGKLVVVGIGRTGSTSTNNFLVARLNLNGSLDTAGFGGGLGYVMTDFGSSGSDMAFDVAMQSDGKIVVAGQATVGTAQRFGLARYNTNGTLDTASDGFDTQEFGVGGRVTTNVLGFGTSNIREVKIQSDGKIVVAGNTSNSSASLADAVLARYNVNGSPDTAFNAAGLQPGVLRVDVASEDFAEGLVIQPDGNYVVVGSSTIVTGVFPNIHHDGRLLAMRVLASTGQLDTSFGTGGVTLTDILPGDSVEVLNDVVIQPDGKIIGGGGFNFNVDFVLARYESGLAVAPSISGAADVDEGDTYTLNLSSDDPTTSQWTINWGDGVEVVSGNPASVTHTYADGDANYTISATATTSTGNVAAGNTVDVMVHNVAPTLSISGAADVDEAAVYTLNLSSFDPGPEPDQRHAHLCGWRRELHDQRHGHG
jgi:uncharacterized delta-60 repeat protein